MIICLIRYLKAVKKQKQKCAICVKSNSQKGDLKRHIDSVHNGKKRTQMFNLCSHFHQKL